MTMKLAKFEFFFFFLVLEDISRIFVQVCLFKVIFISEKKKWKLKGVNKSIPNNFFFVCILFYLFIFFNFILFLNFT